MSGRLRQSPLARVERLEERADAAGMTEESLRGLTPYERAWREAERHATEEELAILAAASERARTQGRSYPDPEHEVAEYALLEQLLWRMSPTLAGPAGDVRASRCLLWRALYRAAEEAKEDHERWVPHCASGSSVVEAAREIVEEHNRLQQRRYGLSTAEINRARVLREGLEPITAPAEAERLLAEVLDAVDGPDGTNRMLRLIGWSQ